MPSRKWWAARIVGLAGVATMALEGHQWATEETIALVALITAGAVSWLVPND